MHRVDTHPRTRAVSPHPGGGDAQANASLAPGLNDGTRRLAEDSDVAAQPVGVFRVDMA